MANVEINRNNIAEVSDEDFFNFFGGVVAVEFEIVEDEDSEDDGWWQDCPHCGRESDGPPCPCSQA